MFLQGIQPHAEKERNAELSIIKNCSHVYNIEKSIEFNRMALHFIENVSKNNLVKYRTQN